MTTGARQNKQTNESLHVAVSTVPLGHLRHAVHQWASSTPRWTNLIKLHHIDRCWRNEGVVVEMAVGTRRAWVNYYNYAQLSVQ